MEFDPGGNVACNSMAKITYHKLQSHCILFTSTNSLHSKLFTLSAEPSIKIGNEIVKIICENLLISLTWKF